MRPQEEHLLLDLSARGIRLIPSATSQMASKSKTFQARIFSPWMIPHTTVIYDIHSLLETVSQYQKNSITKVILKHDRKNAGVGILLYNSIEDVYNQAANNIISFPFVLQPFLAESEDIRVIIIGDYIEAYKRYSPYNFRNNLHCGGTAEPFSLQKKEYDFCQEILKRGDFPYGHLDLMITGEQDIYLAEINLRGGIRGARISTEKYKKKVAAIEKALFFTAKKDMKNLSGA